MIVSLNNTFLFILLFAVALMWSAAQTHARNSKERFSFNEGIGLLDTPQQGALDYNLWTDLSYSEITDIYKSLPARSSSTALQKALDKLYLSSFKVPKRRGRSERELSSDLLTIRLEKLIEGGSYKNAYLLYKRIDAPNKPDLKHAGLLSLFYSGEVALGCLELHTTPASAVDKDFWKDISLYCAHRFFHPNGEKITENIDSKVIRSLAKNEKHRIGYSKKAFNALSQQEQALVSGTGALRAPKTIPKSLQAQHIIPLLNARRLSDYQRITLTAKASAKDLIPFREYTQAARTLGKALTDDGKAASADWQKALEGYYNAYYDTDEKSRSKTISSLLRLNVPAQLLVPITELLSITPAPKAIDAKSIAMLAKISMLGEQQIPTPYAESIIKAPLPKQNRDLFQKSSYASLMNIHSNSLTKKQKTFLRKIINFSEKDINYSKDNPTNPAASAKKTEIPTKEDLIYYENLFPLTPIKDYVIHDLEVWKSLKSARENAIVGKIVAYAVKLFEAPHALEVENDQMVDQAHLLEIKHSLNTVGLTKTARSFVTERILVDD